MFYSRRLVLQLFVCTLATLALPTAGGTVSAESATKPAEEVEIYAALALTGIGAPFGTVERNAISLAIEEVNSAGGVGGRPAKLVLEDTLSTNPGTISAVRKLISLNHAQIILGPTWLDSYQAVLPIIESKRVLLLVPDSVPSIFKKDPTQYPLVFSTWFSIKRQLEVLLAEIQRTSRKQIVLVFDQDPYFQTVRTLVRKMAGQYGITIVDDQSVGLESADFRAILAKARILNAEGVLFGFGNEANLFKFLKQRKELALKLPMFGTEYLDGYVSQKEFLPLFEGVTYSIPRVQDRSFVERYEKRFGSAPVLSASTTYDAARILLQGLEQGHSDPQSLSQYLLSNTFDTVTFGKVKFDAFRGISVSDYVMKYVRDGTTTEASPTR